MGKRYKKIFKVLSVSEDSMRTQKKKKTCDTAVDMSTAMCPQKLSICARRVQ